MLQPSVVELALNTSCKICLRKTAVKVDKDIYHIDIGSVLIHQQLMVIVHTCMGRCITF